MLGEISSQKAQATELKDNLTNEYKNIYPEYMSKLIEVTVRLPSLFPGLDVVRCLSDFSACEPLPQTSELANRDLEKYAKALDKCVPRCRRREGAARESEGLTSFGRTSHSAIMKYHSAKMAEINDNLKYLWNRTYQGTGSSRPHPYCRSGSLSGPFLLRADIDNIIIRSDTDESDTKKASTATTIRKTYNYRVRLLYSVPACARPSLTLASFSSH